MMRAKTKKEDVTGFFEWDNWFLSATKKQSIKNEKR